MICRRTALSQRQKGFAYRKAPRSRRAAIIMSSIMAMRVPRISEGVASDRPSVSRRARGWRRNGWSVELHARVDVAQALPEPAPTIVAFNGLPASPAQPFPQRGILEDAKHGRRKRASIVGDHDVDAVIRLKPFATTCRGDHRLSARPRVENLEP